MGGTVFVFVNTRSPLNPAIVVVLRVLAAIILACMVAMWFLTVRRLRTGGGSPEQTPGPRGRSPFSRGYWLVVIAEVVLLFGGLALLRTWGLPEQANIAWVAFVVGVHFIALGPVWKENSIMVLGAIITVLGVIGFVMAATTALAWVPFVSGVLSGVTLLVGCSVFAWQMSTQVTMSPRP
ncbi:hypothetical protein GCM10022226_12600 [Sphaerisporangium flaviroseum]|uniref:Uncharacterized protein n=1 Tax=Sphaerisporangium flaviroseum TaxID=509199 RepID=A0ABP7HH76_9ACTN